MSKLRNKVKMYMKLQGKSEIDALWAVLSEAEEQIEYMDKTLTKCLKVMPKEDVVEIYGDMKGTDHES